MKKQQAIAFIGAGNMASAIIIGLVNNNFDPSHIWASSPSAKNKVHLQNSQIHLTADNREAAKHADIIILSVKPHMIEAVCRELKEVVSKNNPLIISIASGMTIDAMKNYFEKSDLQIVRAMPNIATTVTASTTGLCANDHIDQSQKSAAETLFRSVGTTVWADSEDKLDAITAVAGSGPGYLFYMFEAMQAAAESLGIEKESAKLLVAETAIGAAKVALESNEDFNQLRRKVTSPNGTTQAATDIMTSNNFKENIIEAINAAYQRAKELAK